MANPAQDYHKGEMEIADQTATFHGFVGMTKWCSLAIAAAVLFLAIWLCAHAGFFRAAIVAAVVVVLGVMVLKEKPSSH